MTQMVSGLFGGGGGSSKQAAAEAERSRQLQAVANDRQLSAANRKDGAVAATRRAPRGRRLFEDGGTSGASTSSVLA